MKHVTFYHSVICPRCQVSKVMLRRALERHPDVQVTHVEMLTNRGRARADGVSMIPALVAQGRTLGGVILTRKRIERFLESLS